MLKLLTVIGFDTATAATAVAASRGEQTVFSAVEGPGPKGRPRHAASLLPLIEQAALSCGGWRAVDRIAVGVGPGTFTGARIGVVTAKALASAHGCELAGVVTTSALGSRAARAAGRDACAVVDGKRGEVFAAVVDPGGQTVWGPEVMVPAELSTRLDRDGFGGPLVGDGAVLHAEELLGDSHRHRLEAEFDVVDAGEVCLIGSAVAAIEPLELMPLYLRRPDAERWTGR